MFDVDMLSRAQVVASSPAELSLASILPRRRQPLSNTVVPSQAATHISPPAPNRSKSHFDPGMAYEERDRLCCSVSPTSDRNFATVEPSELRQLRYESSVRADTTATCMLGSRCQLHTSVPIAQVGDTACIYNRSQECRTTLAGNRISDHLPNRFAQILQLLGRYHFMRIIVSADTGYGICVHGSC